MHANVRVARYQSEEAMHYFFFCRCVVSSVIWICASMEKQILLLYLHVTTGRQWWTRQQYHDLRMSFDLVHIDFHIKPINKNERKWCHWQWTHSLLSMANNWKKKNGWKYVSNVNEKIIYHYSKAMQKSIVNALDLRSIGRQHWRTPIPIAFCQMHRGQPNIVSMAGNIIKQKLYHRLSLT